MSSKSAKAEQIMRESGWDPKICLSEISKLAEIEGIISAIKKSNWDYDVFQAGFERMNQLNMKCFK